MPEPTPQDTARAREIAHERTGCLYGRCLPDIMPHSDECNRWTARLADARAAGFAAGVEAAASVAEQRGTKQDMKRQAAEAMGEAPDIVAEYCGEVEAADRIADAIRALLPAAPAAEPEVPHD